MELVAEYFVGRVPVHIFKVAEQIYYIMVDNSMILGWNGKWCQYSNLKFAKEEAGYYAEKLCQA